MQQMDEMKMSCMIGTDVSLAFMIELQREVSKSRELKRKDEENLKWETLKKILERKGVETSGSGSGNW